MSSFIFKSFEKGHKIAQNSHSVSGETFWQSPLWAQILTQTHQAEIITTHIGENLVIIERREIWHGYSGLYILAVNPGLITEDFIAAVKNKVLTPSDLFLQIEPTDFHENDRFAFHLFNNTAPFRRFIEPKTALLRLQGKTEEELIASFAEKGRYNIRLSEKRGVTTRWVGANEKEKNTGKTYIEVFFDLLDETTKRDGFAHNSLAYYQHFVETLESSNAGGLLIAEKDGILHAAGIFTYWGDTGIYYYGASSSNRDIRRDMATYLLQWGAIREAMRRKCTTYDFLGISADGTGKLAGVTEFKLRFSPEIKNWPAEKIIVYKPLILKILQIISGIRKILR